MSDLRSDLIKLAHANPDGIREHLLPLLKGAASGTGQGRTAGPKAPGGKLLVSLSAEPNPDYDLGSWEAGVKIPAKLVPVRDLRAAVQAARNFIQENNLGGGNWTGGQVYNDKGEWVARISYNGRVWEPGPRGRRTPEIKLAAVASKGTWVARTLAAKAKDLQTLVQRYTGDTEHTRARIKPKGDGVKIVLWLQLEPGDGRAEAQELTDILIGPGGSVGTHKLVPDLWVASKVIK